MRTRSLTRSAMLVVFVAELVSALAFSGFALFHERAVRLHALDTTLRGRSDSLLGAIQDAEDPEDNVIVDPTELSLPEDDLYAVYQLGGRRLGASANAPDEVVGRTKEGFSDVRRGHRRYRVYQRDAMRVIDRSEHPGAGLRRPVTIVYAVGTNHLWHEVFEAAEYYLLLSLALLMLTALLMIVLLRRILRPISDLAVEAASVSSASLDFQAPASALQVRELQPLAEALSAALGGLRQALENERRFVSDASHELKTAVAVVRSTVQVLMMRGRSQEEYAHGMERVLEDNQRVEDLVASMLTLGRMEGSNIPRNAVADLGSGVQSALQKLESYAEEHGVGWKTVFPRSVQVRLAPEKLQVLVSNLLLNAVQHSQRGSTVEVSVRVEDERAWLLVQDAGTGIGPEALAHVFERFYREDTSRSRNTGGAGLGLAICKAIVDAAGGTIEISSSPGQGTLVRVGLRLA